MLEIVLTSSLKRDLKKYKHEKRLLLELQEIITLLAQKRNLLAKHRDHQLSGSWTGHRECHVRNDILLIFKIEDDCLCLVRLGSHSELFK